MVKMKGPWETGADVAEEDGEDRGADGQWDTEADCEEEDGEDEGNCKSSSAKCLQHVPAISQGIDSMHVQHDLEPSSNMSAWYHLPV